MTAFSQFKGDRNCRMEVAQSTNCSENNSTHSQNLWLGITYRITQLIAHYICKYALNTERLFTEEEFRIQEPESRRDSVRQDGQSRLKAPDFNRGSQKILCVTVTPDFRHGVF